MGRSPWRCQKRNRQQSVTGRHTRIALDLALMASDTGGGRSFALLSEGCGIDVDDIEAANGHGHGHGHVVQKGRGKL